jgi:plastocyanin
MSLATALRVTFRPGSSAEPENRGRERPPSRVSFGGQSAPGGGTRRGTQLNARTGKCGPIRATIAAVAALALAALAFPSLASAVETTYEFDVPTGTIDGYEVKQDITLLQGNQVPPVNGFITRMETDVVDATTGQPVPISRLMLHHIVFMNVTRPDKTCTSFAGFDGRSQGAAPQRFFAAGEERAKLSMPPGYGYPHAAGTPWAMLYMVMNHRSAPDNALIHYEVTVESDPLTPVEPWWLDVRDCRADPIYNVPSVEQPPAKPKAKKKKKGKGKKGKKAVASKKRKRKKKRSLVRGGKGWDGPPPAHNEARDYTFPEGVRIVAGAGHVHGGAHGLTLTKPNCGNLEVARSDPTWGLPDHPFYTVRPVLHEPGPINMSAFRSTQGIPVAAGERIRLNSLYDDTLPHTRVMGIFIVYAAKDPGVTHACAPAPPLETLKTNQPGRNGPIPYKIPLTGLDAAGQAIEIAQPPGALLEMPSGSTINVGDRFFGAPNVQIKQGESLTWRFSGNELHNLTLANGPLGIGTDNLDAGRTFTQRFDRPGTYRFFCALHPVDMQERVEVLAPKQKKKKKKGKKGKRKKRR